MPATYLKYPNPIIPDAEKVAEALKLVNYKDLVLDEKKHTAFLRRPMMRIDLGAIAKGAVIDVAARSLKADGFDRVLVNAGGDLYAMCPENAKPWVIGITDPRRP